MKTQPPHLHLACPNRLSWPPPLGSLLLGGALLLPGILPPATAQAQDVRQLSQQVQELDQRSTRELQMERNARAQAESRITALELERVTLIAQVETLLTRMDRMERDNQSREAQPAAQPTTRGFEPSGSGWRFAVGSSFLEVSETGIQLRSGGDLLVEGAQRLELRSGNEGTFNAGMDLRFTSGADLRLTSGTGMIAQSSTNFSVNAGGLLSLQNSSGGSLAFQGNVVSLFGGLVQLGSSTNLKPAAHVESAVVTGAGGGTGSVISGSQRVLVGN